MPTFSLSIGTESTVINKGATNPIAVASANGKYVKPTKRLEIEQTKNQDE